MEFLGFSYLAASMPDYRELSFKTSMLSLYNRTLGYLIIYGSQVLQLDMLITSILLLCIIAMGLYQLLQFAEHCYKKKV